MLPYNLEMDTSDYLEIVLASIREELSKLEKKMAKATERGVVPKCYDEYEELLSHAIEIDKELKRRQDDPSYSECD